MPTGRNNNKKRRKSYSGRKCAQCGVQENLMKHWGQVVVLAKCLSCKNTLYCSHACQLAHWKDHKDYCQQVQRQRDLHIMGIKSLDGVFEGEYLLEYLEELFPSTSTTSARVANKKLLEEAREVVDILRGFVHGPRDASVTTYLLRRLLRGGRAPLQVLCQASDEAERTCIIYQHALNIVVRDDVSALLGDNLPLLKDKKEVNDDGQALSSFQAILDLMRVFPEEDNGLDVIYPILSSTTSVSPSCTNHYSKTRVTLYLQRNFFDHMLLCKALCQRMFCPTFYTPTAWFCGCLNLLHLLVASFSYPEPAEAILTDASKALVFHEDSNSNAGIQQYFQPLLALFQLCQTDENGRVVLHLLSQLAALLVTQSRRVQQCSGEHCFDVPTQYLEYLFTNQFNGAQFKCWNEEYIPWADKVVKARS